MKLDMAIAAIKALEGFRAKVYQDTAGIWTIGYGSTFLDGAHVTSDTQDITEQQAAAQVQLQATVLAAHIALALTRVPTQGQMNAMVVFAYNIGLGNFLKSTFLKKFNANASDDDLRLELLRWTKATDPKTGRKTELAGLTKRREIEYRMFLSPGGSDEDSTEASQVT